MEYTNNGQYKGLPVIESEVIECFEQYRLNVIPELKWEFKKDIAHGKQYSFTLDDDTELLNVFYTKKNTSTLTPTGLNNQIVIPICNYIYSKYNNQGLKGINESYSNFPKDTYDLIIEYFQTRKGVRAENKKLPHGEQNHYVFRGEHLVINYYSTSRRLVLQGKANLLFSEIIYLLITTGYNSSDILALEQTLHDKCFDSSIDVETNLKDRLPNAYDELSEEQLRLIRPSLRSVLNGVDHGEDDNSCIAHPILRGVEHVLKSYLYNQGVEEISSAKSFGGFVDKTEVKSAVSSKITEEQNQQAIIDLYKFYAGNRHVIEHANAMPGDTVIKTCHDAYTLVYDALGAIDTFYDTII